MRKLLLAFGTFFIILIIALVTIQVILTTEIPREITEKALGKKLGTEVSIEKLKTEFAGETQISDLKINLPLKQKAVLNIDSIHIKHNNLFNLITSKDLDISYVNAKGASLYIYDINEQTNVNIFKDRDAKITFRPVNDSNFPEKSISEILIEDPNTGRLEAAISIQNSKIYFDEFNMDILNGRVSGQIDLDVHNWDKSINANILWDNIDFEKLKSWFPKAQKYPCISSGKLEISNNCEEL